MNTVHGTEWATQEWHFNSFPFIFIPFSFRHFISAMFLTLMLKVKRQYGEETPAHDEGCEWTRGAGNPVSTFSNKCTKVMEIEWNLRHRYRGQITDPDPASVLVSERGIDCVNKAGVERVRAKGRADWRVAGGVNTVDYCWRWFHSIPTHPGTSQTQRRWRRKYAHSIHLFKIII